MMKKKKRRTSFFFGLMDDSLENNSVNSTTFLDKAFINKNFYEEGEAIDINTLKHLTVSLDYAQLNLEKKKKDLLDKLDELISTENQNDSGSESDSIILPAIVEVFERKTISESWKDKDLSKYLKDAILSKLVFSQDELDDNTYLTLDYYYDLAKKYIEVKKAHRLVKTIHRQLKLLINTIKKRLRNLRFLFNKLHSSHFKNLDDYHETSFNLSF